MFTIRVVLSQGTRSIDYGIFDVSSASDFNVMRDHLYSIKGIPDSRFWLTSLHVVDKPRHGEWKVVRIAINLVRCECYQDLLEVFEAEVENSFRVLDRSPRARLLGREIFSYLSAASADLMKYPGVSYPWIRNKKLLGVFMTSPFGLSHVHGETFVDYTEVERTLDIIRPDVLISLRRFVEGDLEDN